MAINWYFNISLISFTTINDLILKLIPGYFGGDATNQSSITMVEV